MPMIEPFQPEFEDYLHDESRRVGRADQIAFPKTEAEVLQILQEAQAQSLPITVQGARTGISAGAVPESGLILNLSHMNHLRAPKDGAMRVQPGVTLAAIREATPTTHFFAPDPTEPTASIGGMISCNSSGALSFLHGPTRNHILGLRIATLSGEVLDLQRGRDRADGLNFRLGPYSGTLPPLPQPAVKNAAGYYVKPDMDLLDLFVGAEGTLGVVTEATLQLLPMPGAVWGLMTFLPSTDSVVTFVDTLRRTPLSDGTQLAALEYFNARALDFLRSQAETLAGQDISVPNLPEGTSCVYAEWHAPDEASAEAAMMVAADLLPELGGDPDTAILADNPADIEKLKHFRHALPELVNAFIGERRKAYPGLTKLGTDMSVPDDRLADVLALYEADLAATDLDHLTFGHIGANHLHVNILPRTPADYDAGKALYLRWAESIIAWGGSISAEHGIGKLKRELFRQMVGDDALLQMHALKQIFDPRDLLSPGNLWEGAPS
jgi:D-lactate dehydrogenase (cytochrome)